MIYLCLGCAVIFIAIKLLSGTYDSQINEETADVFYKSNEEEITDVSCEAIEEENELDKYQYKQNRYFINRYELKIFKILAELVKGQAVIFPKVRVADVLEVNSFYYGHVYRRLFKQISTIEVDFLICEENSYKIIGAINVSEGEKNQQELAFIKEVFNAAKLPCELLPSTMCDVKLIKYRLKSILNCDFKEQ